MRKHDADDKTPTVNSADAAEAGAVRALLESFAELERDLRPFANVLEGASGPSKRDFYDRLSGVLRAIGEQGHNGARLAEARARTRR